MSGCSYNCQQQCSSLTYNITNATKYKYPYIRDVSLFLFIIGVIHVIVSFCLFAYYQKRFLRLQRRSLFLAFANSGGVLLQLYGGVFDQYIILYCYQRIASTLAVVPICGLVVLIRLLQYLNNNVFSQAIVDHLNKSLDPTNAQLTNSLTVTVPASSTSSTVSPQSTVSTNVNDGNLSKSISWNQRIYMWFISSDFRIKMLKQLSSSHALVVLMIVFLLPFFIASAVEWSKTPMLDISAQCIGCGFTTSQRQMILAAGISICLFCLIVAWIVRKYPDSLSILAEIRLFAVGGVIALVGFLLGSYVKDGDLTKYFSHGWISWLGVMIFQFATCTWQVICAFKEDRLLKKTNKIQDDGNNNSSSNKNKNDNEKEGSRESGSRAILRSLLQGNDPITLEKFEKYLQGEFSIENLRMYLECQEWEKKYYDMTELSRRARAKKIVEFFVKTNSLFYVNLAETMREKIIKNVENASKPLEYNLFEDSQREMFDILFGSYVRFSHR